MNWKSESTWAAIAGGLIAILTGTGVLLATEGAQATAIVANLSAGIIGLVTLIRGVRNRLRSGSDE